MTAYFDERLKQNQDFTSKTFVLENPDGSPTDLTGASATLSARYGNSETASPAVTLTSPAGGITLNGVYGTLYYKLTAAQTLGLTPSAISYDLFVVLADGSRRTVSGVWRLAASVG